MPDDATELPEPAHSWEVEDYDEATAPEPPDDDDEQPAAGADGVPDDGETVHVVDPQEPW